MTDRWCTEYLAEWIPPDMPTDTFVGVDAPLTGGRVYGPALPYEMRMQRLINKLMNWSACMGQ